jgi:hypothetical protein
MKSGAAGMCKFILSSKKILFRGFRNNRVNDASGKKPSSKWQKKSEAFDGN